MLCDSNADAIPDIQKRGWRTAQGKPPTNLDLFHELNRLVEESETDSLKIAFWHIPREVLIQYIYLSSSSRSHRFIFSTTGWLTSSPNRLCSPLSGMQARGLRVTA
jgi:hypothetical protein